MEMDFDEIIENNSVFFTNRCSVIFSNLTDLKRSYKVLLKLLNEIESFASFYDFDKEVQGNGYRSFVDISRAHVIKAYELCQKLKLQREKFIFSRKKFIRGLQSYNIVIDELVEIAKYFVESRDKSGSLFTEIGIYDNKLIQLYDSMDHVEGFNAFACISPKNIQTLNYQLQSAMSAHSQAFDRKVPRLFKYGIYVFYYFYYLIDGKARIARVKEVFDNRGARYFQDAMKIVEDWFITIFETLIEPHIRFKKIFHVNVIPLKIVSELDGHEIQVPLPRSKAIECFLYMNKDRMKQPSKYLIFHIHGGGFIAESPKGHGAYLKTWANELDVPVLSINYSLSPQAVFPEALDQCFYMYCLALKQPQRFGWTGEKIVLTGDSAGGNLATACTIKCIEIGIPRPTGVLIPYGVFAPQYLACPSRFLGFYELTVPFYLYNRVFSAYHGVRDHTSYNDHDVSTQRKKIENLFSEKTKNYLCSTHLAPAEILEKFPPTRIVSTNLDPCLDECVEFAKRMKSSNANVSFEVLRGVPHGFLCICSGDKTCKKATAVCTNHIYELFQMKEKNSKKNE